VSAWSAKIPGLTQIGVIWKCTWWDFVITERDYEPEPPPAA
jgi:hypothetical protein